MNDTPRSIASRTSDTDWAVDRPVPRPTWLFPPQPRPSTLTLSPVLPCVVYCKCVPSLTAFFSDRWLSVDIASFARAVQATARQATHVFTDGLPGADADHRSGATSHRERTVSALSPTRA